MKAIGKNPIIFGGAHRRPRNMVDYLIGDKIRTEVLSANVGVPNIGAAEVLGGVLEGLGQVWPGRLAIEGVNLGDVWIYPGWAGDQESDRYVPFHKLSQWLTYSLLEPIEEIRLEISGLDQLTGLAQ